MIIVEYSVTTAELAKLKLELAEKKYDCSNATGMASAKFGRRRLVTLRTDLEKKRKEIKAPALDRCKLIDTEAKRIEMELITLESPIDSQIKEQEAVEELKRQEKARLSAQAEQDFQLWTNEIIKLPLKCIDKESHEISTFLAALEARLLVPPKDATFVITDDRMIRAEAAKAEAVVVTRDMMEKATVAEVEATQLAEIGRVSNITGKIQNIQGLESQSPNMSISTLLENITYLELLAIGDDEFQEFRAEAQAAKVSALQTLTDELQEKQEAQRVWQAQQDAMAAAQEQLDHERAIFEAERAEVARRQAEDDRIAAEAQAVIDAENKRIADEAAAAQRETERQAAVAAEVARKKAETDRKASEKARKLAESKCATATDALKKILDICQTTSDPKFAIDEIATICEGNITI
jgi:hypothetical protein